MLQDANTIEAAHRLRLQATTPVSLHRQDVVELDNTAVAVPAASVTDAFEQLLQYFFVMNVEYPQELWLSYIFIERVLGLKATVAKSMQLAEFFDEVTE